MAKIIVTGAAGFIGSCLVSYLLENTKHEIVGIDSGTDYYDINIKKKNITRNSNERYVCYHEDILHIKHLNRIFDTERPDYVFHFAAQPGVMYSVNHTTAVMNTNVIGFLNVMDACNKYGVKKFLYASSSSIYGDGLNGIPQPVSPYGVSKYCDEMLAEVYSRYNDFDLHAVGLRFYTVYGPYMRPDLAIAKFTRSIIDNKPITVFGDGIQMRDFTYIDDVVRICVKLMDSQPRYYHELFNIGTGDNWSIRKLIDIIIEAANPEYDRSLISYDNEKPYDVKSTLATTRKLEARIHDKPTTTLTEGIKQYIEWYKSNDNMD